MVKESALSLLDSLKARTSRSPSGPFSLQRARELVSSGDDSAENPAFAAGLLSLDTLLEGGIHRAQLTELIREPSGGSLSLLLALMATATARGEAVAFVDLGNHLDPTAISATGAELSRLLWVRPRRLREALAATEALLTGGFPLVILDLGLTAFPDRGTPQGVWLRLARTAARHQNALLLSTPRRISGAAATRVLRLRRRRAHWQGRTSALPLLTTLSIDFFLEKSRPHKTGKARCELRLAEAHQFRVQNSEFRIEEGRERKVRATA
jgi:hypothetical protein